MKEPGAREGPVALRGTRRAAQDRGDFFDLEAAEEAELDQAREPRLGGGELIERAIEIDQLLGIHGRRDTVIPLSSSEALYRIAPEPKRMLIDDASGHNDIWSDSLTAEIVRFVDASASGRIQGDPSSP